MCPVRHHPTSYMFRAFENMAPTTDCMALEYFSLSQQMTQEDFEYFLRHLPRRKAAGVDEVNYEMLASAPPNQQAIILEGLNQLLAGRKLPADWKGGKIRLLSKREPAHLIENMRPVTLLQTTYKLLSAVVTFRLQRMA